MPNLDLRPFHIQHPEKLQWIFPHTQVPENTSVEEHVISKITSSSLRSLFRKTDELLAEQHIAKDFHELTEAEYLQWLTYYQQKMTELGYEVVAQPQWFSQKYTGGKVVEGLFFTQIHSEKKNTVGSGVIVIEPQQKATLAFKASERLNLSSRSNSSLGSFIDYCFLVEMVRRQIPIISGGSSPNHFVVGENLGYIDYKLRFYIPQQAAESQLSTTLEIPKPGDTVFCFGQDSDQDLNLYIFHPEGQPPTIDLNPFQHEAFQTIQLPYQPNQVIG
jgi:hypothetical protein